MSSPSTAALSALRPTQPRLTHSGWTLEQARLPGQRVSADRISAFLEKSFVLQPDLNRSKDFFATASMSKGPISAYLVGYLGRGQLIDATALRVKNYNRLGTTMSGQFAKTFAESLGETKVIAELTFGTNMDTGVFNTFALPTIPTNFADGVKDVNERGFYVRIDQELTKWGIAGFRFDTYTTNSAIKNNARDTYAFMAGANFSKYLRLINEISYTFDNLHPEPAPAPSKHIFGFTSWLQGRFY
jgi:hypothetical protein